MGLNDGRVLVLGGSSFVGIKLREKLGATAVSTYNSAAFDGGVRFDAVTMSVKEIVDPSDDIGHAVILMGDTQPDSCVADPARSRDVNVESIERLIGDLLDLDIRPVFTSSEFVFDGHKGNYVETDDADPILLYGAQKLEVEKHLESVCEDFAILRLAKVYGLEPGDGTLFTGMLNAITRQREIRCATDQRFSPVFVGDVVSAVIKAVEKPLRGVFHVAGPEANSRLELFSMLIDTAGEYRRIDVSVEPCSIDDFDLPEARPKDVSMRPDKLVAQTGLKLLAPKDACRRVCEAAIGNAA